MHVREASPDAPVLKLGLSCPPPMEKIRAFASTVDTLLVVEETEPLLELAMAGRARGTCRPAATRRFDHLSAIGGRTAVGEGRTDGVACRGPASSSCGRAQVADAAIKCLVFSRPGP